MEGIITAMLTPFDENQRIDEEVTRNHVNRLINEGVHGLFILGTNGEFFSMSSDEKVEYAKIVVDEVNGRIPVCAGTGAINTNETIELTKRMEQVGVDSVSVLTPYLMTISQKELLNHYKRIAVATKLPMIIYHMPGRTNNTLTPDTVAELSKISNIVGIKDSTGNFDQILKFIEATEEDFAVYSGADSLILWTLMAGGKGAIAATSNMYPKLVVSIYENWKNGEIEKAREAQEKLRKIRDASNLASTPAVFKAAMEILGVSAGPPRYPVEQVSEEVKNKLIEIMNEYK